MKQKRRAYQSRRYLHGTNSTDDERQDGEGGKAGTVFFYALGTWQRWGFYGARRTGPLGGAESHEKRKRKLRAAKMKNGAGRCLPEPVKKCPFTLPSREESGAERSEGKKRKIGANHCQKSWHFQPQVYFLGVFLGKRLFLGFACL